MFNHIKYVIYGVVAYFISIYVVPLIIAFIFVNQVDFLVAYEDIISVVISLIILAIIGLLIKKKDGIHSKTVLITGIIILIFSLPGLIFDFSYANLVHDLLIIPIMLMGFIFNKK